MSWRVNLDLDLDPDHPVGFFLIQQQVKLLSSGLEPRVNAAAAAAAAALFSAAALCVHVNLNMTDG